MSENNNKDFVESVFDKIDKELLAELKKKSSTPPIFVSARHLKHIVESAESKNENFVYKFDKSLGYELIKKRMIKIVMFNHGARKNV